MTIEIIDGMSNAEYHADPAISKSGLDEVNRSPLHYWTRYLDPNREPRKETPALAFGTAVHCAILEPDRFVTDYIKAPKFDRRTNAGKAAAAEFEAANAGRLWLDGTDYDACLRVRDAMRDHPAVAHLLRGGKRERSLFWTDELLTNDVADDPLPAVQCKARPDWLADDYSIIADVKTTDDARSAAFSRSIWNYRYHVQAALYLDGVRAVTAELPRLFVFIVVEKEPPYACAVYYADEGMIEQGRREYRRNLETYRICKARNEWTAYPEDLLPIGLPAYARRADSFAVN